MVLLIGPIWSFFEAITGQCSLLHALTTDIPHHEDFTGFNEYVDSVKGFWAKPSSDDEIEMCVKLPGNPCLTSRELDSNILQKATKPWSYAQPQPQSSFSWV